MTVCPKLGHTTLFNKKFHKFKVLQIQRKDTQTKKERLNISESQYEKIELKN